MSSEKARLRFYDLHSRVAELVREGKRDAEGVANVLQVVNDDPEFRARFFPAPAVTAVILGTAEEQIVRLQPLYRELFGFEFNSADVRVPEAPPGFNRIIVASDKLRLNRIVAGLRKRMKVWLQTEDLDAVVERAPYIKRLKGTYAVWVRENREADEDTRGRSAKDLEREGVNCLTLEERLLYEAIYFSETGKHLDVSNWTLCAGSRYRDGNVPSVNWSAEYGKVYVCWWSAGDRRGSLGARLAVSA